MAQYWEYIYNSTVDLFKSKFRGVFNIAKRESDIFSLFLNDKWKHSIKSNNLTDRLKMLY